MPSLLGFRRRQPRSTQAAIADPSIATIVPQAVSQLGGAITRAGVVGSRLVERRNNELARADFEGMKAATAVARNEFIKSLRTTDKDYNGINKAWADFKKKNFKLIGNTTKQRKAQKAYGMYIGGIIPQWDRDIDNIAWGVSAERAQVKVFNSAVSQLQTTPLFEEGLILANQTIERSKLLTSEQKDLAFANAVIEVDPQRYLDIVDAKGTKELFELLSSDQKRTLETKARSDIRRVNAELLRQRKEVENETLKNMSVLRRENRLSVSILDANRNNMSAGDFERYNKFLVDQGKAQKVTEEKLRKIKDEFNRDIFLRTEGANTIAALDEMKRATQQFVKQRKLSVEDGKKRLAEINKKLDDLVVTEAEGFPIWSTLDDKVTAVQANPTKENIDALSKEIDEAVIAAPGTQALITVNQGTKLQNRLSGIEKNPALKKRPSLTRAHAVLGRLRQLQVRRATDKEDIRRLAGQKDVDTEAITVEEQIIAIENSFIRIAEELDAFADEVASDKDFDAKISQKLEGLTRPVIEEVTLGFLQSLILPKTSRFQLPGTKTEEIALIEKRLDSLEGQPRFKRLTTEEQLQARGLVESGLTVEQAVSQAEEGRDGFVSMISPAGKPFEVPIEKKQLFLDNGFKER